MRLALVLPLTLSACVAPAYSFRPDHASNVPERWFAAISLPTGKTVTILEGPSLEQVARSLPANAKSSLRIYFDCGVTERGKLTKCQPTQMSPDTVSTVQAGRSLLPHFRLSAEGKDLVQRFGGRLLLSMYIDDEARKLDRSCPSPWCAITPAPPPPPPPRERTEAESVG
jgi:hypothetical protein